MKKLVLSIMAVLAFTWAQAQDSGIKLGGHVDVPIGDASDLTSIGFGADLAYMFDVSEEFKLGATVGYLSYQGKKEHGEKRDNLGFLPIAAVAQFSLAENIFIGADVGYALGLSPDYNKGGFYYMPKVGYQIDLFEVYVGYKGIANKFEISESIGGIDISASDKKTLSAIAIGFNYKF